MKPEVGTRNAEKMSTGDAGLGSRNSEWMNVRLGDVVEIDRMGVNPSDFELGENYLGLEHLNSDGGITWGATTESEGVKSTKFRFTKDHILFGKLRPYLRKVVRPDRSGVCSTDILPLLPKDGHYKDFLFHFLRTDELIRRATESCSGANLPRLSPEHFRVFEFRVPRSPAAQRRIAEILDQADALRAKRRAALAELDTLSQSIFLEMFGDPITNPKAWRRAQLGQMVERITKGESPGWQGFDYQDDGALFVTSENVRLGGIDLSHPKFIPLEFNRKLFRSELKSGDLLVNLVGASIGRSCIFPGYKCPANINQAVAVVTVNSSLLENTFLAGLLASERGQWLLLSNRVEGARANISLTDLRELTLFIPPISLQREFAQRITAVEELKTAHRNSLAELDTLFSSLQHRAFRGEL